MDVATTALALSGIGAGLEILRRYVVAPGVKYGKATATRVRGLFDKVDEMALALGPNGGQSLADKLERVEQQTSRTNDLVQVTSGRVDRLTDWIERPVYETDADGRITRPNEGFCKLAGVSAAELIGMGWLSLIVEADRDRLMREIAWAKRDRRAYRVRVVLESGAGKRFEVQMIAHPKMDANDGEILAYFGAIEVVRVLDQAPSPIPVGGQP